MPRLQIGSKVLYRLFNTPKNKFYGETKTGQITEIIAPTEYATAEEKRYKVKHEYGEITLKRKEIQRILN